MAYVIAEPCIDHMDRACVEVCPVDCITSDPDDRKLFIDPQSCIDCGSCETACPNEAIFRQDQLPPAWASYARIDAAWQSDPATARRELGRLIGVA